jgi:hypothetical protein
MGKRSPKATTASVQGTMRVRYGRTGPETPIWMDFNATVKASRSWNFP